MKRKSKLVKGESALQAKKSLFIKFLTGLLVVWFLIFGNVAKIERSNHMPGNITFIEDLECELITISAELAQTTLQPLTGRTAARIVALAAQITATVAKAL